MVPGEKTISNDFSKPRKPISDGHVPKPRFPSTKPSSDPKFEMGIFVGKRRLTSLSPLEALLLEKEEKMLRTRRSRNRGR